MMLLLVRSEPIHNLINGVLSFVQQRSEWTQIDVEGAFGIVHVQCDDNNIIRCASRKSENSLVLPEFMISHQRHHISHLQGLGVPSGLHSVFVVSINRRQSVAIFDCSYVVDVHWSVSSVLLS